MATATRRGTLAIATVVVLLAIGVGVALAIGDLLSARPGASAASADVPESAEWALTWLARILLLLALMWVAIGWAASRTRIVRRPGAAAARSTWIASIFPWHARESTLGMYVLDRWLLFAVPAALLIATRLVQTSFLAWTHVIVVVSGWVIFALVIRMFVWHRSPWPVMAAVGGAVVLRCILTLAVLSVAGPGTPETGMFTQDPMRVTYTAIAFTLFVWVYVVACWALSTQLGWRKAVGAVLAAVGAGLAIPATIVGVVGFERVLQAWEEQFGMFFWEPSLALLAHLSFPDAVAWWAAAGGAAVALIGLALTVPGVRVRAGS